MLRVKWSHQNSLSPFTTMASFSQNTLHIPVIALKSLILIVLFSGHCNQRMTSNVSLQTKENLFDILLTASFV